MRQRHVGSSGLSVSRLGLGTMTWGRDTDQHEAAEQLTAFLDAGGTLIDTAASFAEGDAERVLGIVLGQVLGRRYRRGDVVIAGKAGTHRHDGRRRVDVSRRALLADLDTSLRRLETDHLDLWQLHGWSDTTPLDESLAAADHAVSSGRVRYVGVSGYRAWQTSWAAHAFGSIRPGNALVSAQVEYSLLARDAESDVIPATRSFGMGLLPYAPLGRGLLTGRGAAEQPPSPAVRGIVDAVGRAADGLGLAPAEVALAWVRDRPGVSAPIVGARTAAHLKETLGVEHVELPPEIADVLTEVSDVTLTAGGR